MLVFNPSDPFPILDNLSLDYEAEKAHAACVDAWLGLQTEEVERSIVEKYKATPVEFRDSGRSREFWIGKSVQIFSTPYTELRMMLEDVGPHAQDTVVDLGAGYGRMAHVLARHFPGVIFKGFEMVRERHEESARSVSRHGLTSAVVECADVTALDFSALSARIYFLYDFGSRQDVEAVVEKFKDITRNRQLTVIARGGRSRDIIEKRHPWLSQVVKPRHRKHYSIYRSGIARAMGGPLLRAESM